jgi:acyl carrier protein
MTHEDIFEKVKDCLVAALDVEPEEVIRTASLTEDLEAESIDFVDIIYRLEQTFKVKIPQGELFPQELFSNKDFVDGGAFTEAGMKALKEQYPFLDTGDDAVLKVTELPRLYTVDMLVKFVASKAA